MEIENVATRLKKFINETGLTDSQFADTCGISRSTLSLFLSGKNKKLNDVILSQIHSSFPNLSIQWLLFNEGNMDLNSSKENDTNGNLDEKLDESFTFDDFGIDPLVENEKFPGNYSGVSEYSKEMEAFLHSNALQNIVNKYITLPLNEISEVNKKLLKEKMQRKVVKITIYYDDNTFETFKPDED